MYWRYFKAALSHQGLTLRAKTMFHGTADEPCHIEIDEAVVKQTKLFGDDGELRGTLHRAVFGITQRGSRRAVVYMMTPRVVPVRTDNAAGAAAPPPSMEELFPWLQHHIGDWVVIHTDKAGAYPALLEGLLRTRCHVKMDSVNHAAKQWTSFARHPVEGHPNVSRIRCIAGTQMVEAMWKVLKYRGLCLIIVCCCIINARIFNVAHFIEHSNSGN